MKRINHANHSSGLEGVVQSLRRGQVRRNEGARHRPRQVQQRERRRKSTK
jgi:hypothetical protein